MKKTILVLLLMSVLGSFAQGKFIDKNGVISFEASVPSFEEVKAKNESVTFVLNSGTGELESLVLIKAFKFKLPMMEEHFNFDYMESDAHPKATFKGKIQNFNYSTLTKIPKYFVVNGKIKIHGKANKISLIANIRKVENSVVIDSEFKLNTDDFDILIPNIVSKKISKNVIVTLNANLKLKN